MAIEKPTLKMLESEVFSQPTVNERLRNAYQMSHDFVSAMMKDPSLLRYSAQAMTITATEKPTTRGVELFRYMYGLYDHQSDWTISPGLAMKLIYISSVEMGLGRLDIAGILGVNINAFAYYSNVYKCTGLLEKPKVGEIVKPHINVTIGNFVSPDFLKKLEKWQQWNKDRISRLTIDDMGESIVHIKSSLVRAGLTTHDLIYLPEKEFLDRLEKAGVQRPLKILSELLRVFKKIKLTAKFAHSISILDSNDPDFMDYLVNHNPPICTFTALLNTQIYDFENLEDVLAQLKDLEETMARWEKSH